MFFIFVNQKKDQTIFIDGANMLNINERFFIYNQLMIITTV